MSNRKETIPGSSKPGRASSKRFPSLGKTQKVTPETQNTPNTQLKSTPTQATQTTRKPSWSSLSPRPSFFSLPPLPNPLASSNLATAHRRAGKSARALQQLIVPSPPIAQVQNEKSWFLSWDLLDSGEKRSTVPLREKDVSRLRKQLLDPTQAGVVIKKVRSLPLPPVLSPSEVEALPPLLDSSTLPHHPTLSIAGYDLSTNPPSPEPTLPVDSSTTRSARSASSTSTSSSKRKSSILKKERNSKIKIQDLPTIGAGPTRAVCLDVTEPQAASLILQARKSHLQGQLPNQTSSTGSNSRLPVLLSLLQQTTSLTSAQFPHSRQSHHLSSSSRGSHSGVWRRDDNDEKAVTEGKAVLPFGLLMPPSAMSLHRPLAGALPTPETLKRGFEALLNAEGKVYNWGTPSHVGLSPPDDRMSVYTYWWGFELVLLDTPRPTDIQPPPTLDYLNQVKEISVALLTLLGVIVYAVPGGTRELAPFVGVLSRYIETEWALLKDQDQGQGVVCGATWFIPAAVVARPWDFDSPDDIDEMNDSEETLAVKTTEIKGEVGV
ncbi:hypothetical protein M231_06167 [Tremella mesenterica]|uniref:Uncharacterized protein n=1 Tax=Tremella mesenterica TaxID=5217 RepID=A0A4Q1BE01_TREME|nr:hypothetical protein M231_06167 [Tremella mesenterica]